jgi:hypothetical protein
MAYKNRKTLLAENKRLRAQAARKGKGTNSKKAKVFKNVAGVACKSKFTANISSNKIVRHLHGECGCNPGKGFRCYAAKNYDGYDWDNLGHNPHVTWTPLV